MLDEKLVDYIEKSIMPVYDGFDSGHDRRHIKIVIKNSLELAEDFDLDINMIYTIAAYHDIGMEYGRENHHIDSGRILERDEFIRSYFNPKDILIMKEAVEDHRASKSGEPRTIYGKIVAEADRDLDYRRIMERTILFSLKNYGELDRDGHIERSREHLGDKYGRHGYLKLWLETDKNISRLEKLRQLIDDEDRLVAELNTIYDDILNGETYL